MNVESIAPVIRKASGWLVLWSAVVFVCGILAVILPLTFSFAIQARSTEGFLWQVLVSLLYVIAAVCLLVNPLLSVLSLSLLLAIFLLLEGILELVLYFRLRRSRHSVWLVMDGVGTLILGILMVRQWPPDSPAKIGALIGISLMLSAFSRLMFLLALRALKAAPA